MTHFSFMIKPLSYHLRSFTMVNMYVYLSVCITGYIPINNYHGVIDDTTAQLDILPVQLKENVYSKQEHKL
mgnify:CR=1 FL=1